MHVGWFSHKIYTVPNSKKRLSSAMIITCPSCSAKFAVKAEAIGPEGRKVRCAKCRHDWFQDPPLSDTMDGSAFASPEAKPVPEGSNLPVVPGSATPLHIKMAFACMALAAFVTLSITASNSVLPHMGWYYGIMGIHNDQGIALDKVSAIKNSEDGKNELLVKGHIVNESKSDRPIPNLEIKLLSKERKELRVVTLDSEGTTLAPGEGIDFENRIMKLPEGVATVVMDIGNKVNLASR